MKELSEKTKKSRIKKLCEECRWLNKKNFKHLSAYSARWESTYAQENNKCRFTGGHALWTIQHKRHNNGAYEEILRGLSLEAILLIEKEIGEQLEKR